MIERFFRVFFRKHKLSGLALISVMGLASAFAVNLAGFLVLLPKPLWGLLDAAFVSSYFMRFSILLALAMLASRYSVYITSELFGLVVRVFVTISLLTKKSGRRLIHIRGTQQSTHVASLVAKHNDNEAKLSLTNLFHSRFGKSALGFFYILGQTQGRIEFRIERLAIPIQLIVIVSVLSALYTTLFGGIILVVLGAAILFFIPPKPTDMYFSKPYSENGISFFLFLKLKPFSMMNIQKITLLVLTLSFVSGVLHHLSLVTETRKVNFLGEANLSGSLVVAGSSGFIVYSTDFGYQFMPIDGTRIVIPLN